jgi:hypothetical protein
MAYAIVLAAVILIVYHANFVRPDLGKRFDNWLYGVVEGLFKAIRFVFLYVAMMAVACKRLRYSIDV